MGEKHGKIADILNVFKKGSGAYVRFHAIALCVILGVNRMSIMYSATIFELLLDQEREQEKGKSEWEYEEERGNEFHSTNNRILQSLTLVTSGREYNRWPCEIQT